MALFHAHFFSESIGMQSEAVVIVPQPSSGAQIGVKTASARKTWPCLWLLHGLSDDHTIWSRRTSIERYAEQAGIAVVMPNAHRSFYRDMVHGGAYHTYITKELPTIMRSFFPLSTARRDNAVAGLSMGGYGAANWLLTQPEAFVAGVSLSGVMDIATRYEKAIRNPEEPLRQASTHQVFGDTSPAGTDADLLHLTTEIAKTAEPPPLLQICGTNDFLIEDNRRFRDHAQNAGYPLTYREAPGDHSWTFWDEHIQAALTWLTEQGFGASAL